MQQSPTYQSLLQKLDQFTRKYYTNQLIRGGIFSLIYILAFFLAINVLEYYLYLSPPLRKVLFYGFIGSSLLFFARFVGLPLMNYYKLGKVISHEKAAAIIGQHFVEVKDKLLNVLQLQKEAAAHSDAPLLLAGIDQKIGELKPITFSNAIDLKTNRRYVKYLVPPVLLFLFIILAAPNIIKDGTNRLYHNDTFYEKEAPFHFVIVNKQLQALQFENFELQVKTEGSVVPNDITLQVDGNSYPLKKKDKNLFTHEFISVQKPETFYLSANGFRSKDYVLAVVAKPQVAGFKVSCIYPAYIGKTNETIKNAGDLTVPAGTKLTWTFEAKNTDEIRIVMGDSNYLTKRNGEEEFTFAKTVLQSVSYAVKVSNAKVKNADSVGYSLNVTPDLFPTIQVSEKRDSVNQKYFYYIGEASDDYGLKRLNFNYQIQKAEGGNSINKAVDVPFNAGSFSRFTYYWNTTDLGIQPGDKMTYYFEVWDNDGVHGSKSTKSGLMAFEMPSVNELNKEVAKENKEIKEDLKETMKQAAKLKDELKDMQDKMVEKKNLNWEDKKNVSDMLDKQKNLEKQLQEMKEKFNQNIEKQNDFKDINAQVKEKQKKLQDLFNNLMSDEMKKLYDKLDKMMEAMQKKEALDKMQDMEFNNEKLEKELDRMLELFKKLEFDQKLQETADKLDKLAEKQEQLAKQAENKKEDSKELKDKQEKLSSDLKDTKKDVEDLKKLKEESKADADLKQPQEDLKNAEDQMNQAEQNLDQKKNEKASQNQKQSASAMKKASQSLKDTKKKMEEEEAAEDMQAIRQLLKNIVSLSFDEEKLMNDVKTTNINVPKYLDLMQEQQRIRENSKMVEDSLFAVAKRQIKIESFVTKEITGVNRSLAKAIDNLEDRDVYRAMSNQQFVMTGYNKLALMLSESLQQMQEQMSDSKEPKDGKPKMCKSCKKPGNGLPNLSKMQQQLNDKISQMAEMMKKEGEGKSGQSGQGKSGMSKQFAEMAAKQAEIRRELQKINQQENKDGKNSLGNLGQAIQQMEQNESNLVNKQLTAEMIRRQQEIMTRLLEAENAEKQRGEKQERESTTGKEIERKQPSGLEEYLKQQKSEVDLYKTVPPSLRPYYKTLAEKYFKSITLGN